MSEGLPGRLTISHIEMAEERGDNYITYHHVTYSLAELKKMAGIKGLKDGAGISGIKPKPKISANVHSNRVDNSDGESSELSSDSRKE